MNGMWFTRHLKSAQTTGQKIAVDAAVAFFLTLVVSFVLASLSAAGVITMTVAIILLILAWIVAMAGTFLMPHIWNPSHKHRILFGVALAVLFSIIGMVEARYQPTVAQTTAPTQSAAASPPANSPSYSQDCKPGASCSQGQTGGQNIGTLNQYGTLHKPNGLYQNGQSIGLGSDSIVDEAGGTVSIVNPRVSGGSIDFDEPFELRSKENKDYVIKCPELRPMHPGAASVTISIMGSIKCSIIKD